MKGRIILGVAGMGLIGVVAFSGWAADPNALQVQGDSELFEGVPAAAAAALTTLAGAGAFESVERQRTGPVEVYMATWKLNGHAHDATVSADGVLIEGNERLDVAQVPPPVQRVATEFYGREAQPQYHKKTIVVYSVRSQFHGHEHEIIISPTGDLADDGGAAASTQPAADVPATAPALTKGR